MHLFNITQVNQSHYCVTKENTSLVNNNKNTQFFSRHEQLFNLQRVIIWVKTKLNDIFYNHHGFQSLLSMFGLNTIK